MLTLVSTPRTPPDVDGLVDALPSLQRVAAQTVVVKLGGAAIQAAGPDAILADVALLRLVGTRTVLVHGGGPEITEAQRRAGIEPRFRHGLRVTDGQTIEIVKTVLTKQVGPTLAAGLRRLGGNAVTLSGEDGSTLLALPHEEPGDEDLGYVGDVVRTDPTRVEAVLDAGGIPVVATLARGADGHTYNVNADAAAAELALALDAGALVLLTDVPGVRDRDGELIPELTADRARVLVEAGVVTGGMIPKIDAALRALQGTSTVHILDGRIPHALLRALLTDQQVGTTLVRSSARTRSRDGVHVFPGAI
ncbi:MAG TPA: acetylglutamate kinase [Candidatus Angelobacter sp.]|jgi:acetylglutamate kinase|nr:acetylglutamate kinase [Candidatus Angelobacter sp.]